MRITRIIRIIEIIGIIGIMATVDIAVVLILTSVPQSLSAPGANPMKIQATID